MYLKKPKENTRVQQPKQKPQKTNQRRPVKTLSRKNPKGKTPDKEKNTSHATNEIENYITQPCHEKLSG